MLPVQSTCNKRIPLDQSKQLDTALELKQKEILLNCSTTIITGDLNMKSTNWETMSSRDTNEDSLLTDLLDSGFHEFLHDGEEKQLDVC